jgi:hypothetical protein
VLAEPPDVAGAELVPPEPPAVPVTLASELDVQHLLVTDRVGTAFAAELAAARAEAAAAVAETEELRERVRILESWLEAAAQRRHVDYVQAQRLAMMKAVERDERFAFVLSLPLVLLVLYCAALVAVVWLLVEGRV